MTATRQVYPVWDAWYSWQYQDCGLGCQHFTGACCLHLHGRFSCFTFKMKAPDSSEILFPIYKKKKKPPWNNVPQDCNLAYLMCLLSVMPCKIITRNYILASDREGCLLVVLNNTYFKLYFNTEMPWTEINIRRGLCVEPID